MRRAKRIKTTSPSQPKVEASRAAFTKGELKSGTNVPSPTGIVAVPPPPAGAKWRIEQDVPGHGWQFSSYACDERQRKQRLESIKNFGGRARAVAMHFAPTFGENPSVGGGGFIGDGEGSAGGRTTRPPYAKGAEGAMKVAMVGSPAAPCSTVVEVRVAGGGPAGRLLQAQAAHWLRCANDAGCDVKLSPRVLEEVLEASKRALHSRSRAFADAQNRAPRTSR